MKIKPVLFNYGDLVKDHPNTEVKVQRKNVVVDNSFVGMWGENIDEENQIMLLKSISAKRDHTKNSKETLVDLWESILGQYADIPEEIEAKMQEKQEKEAERKKKAEELAKKAEEKAMQEKTTKEKAAKAKENSSKDQKEQVS